ncbi:hypothetical protein C8J57DRAFT_1246529 [Mycena rebaudengoi]|nr:hypothetical protein C8J57DRAFT_1246529 [Mycena rebaudengoi]
MLLGIACMVHMVWHAVLCVFFLSVVLDVYSVHYHGTHGDGRAKKNDTFLGVVAEEAKKPNESKLGSTCSYIFLYMLILAIDANFRLKNQIQVNEHNDPPLGPGWGAFVEPTEYREHLRTYVPEKAVHQECAPTYWQKRYAKHHWPAMFGCGGCALAGFALMMLTLSYDIGCQWKANFASCNTKMPERICLDIAHTDVQCGRPVWHASSHEELCRNKNSLRFILGIGKMDGEGIERLWAFLNPAAFHTLNMGSTNRADWIEDKLDFNNFLKNIGQGDALRRKLLVTIAERARQIHAYKEVSSMIATEVKQLWSEMIKDFVKDHDKPNPYVIAHKDGATEVEIRLKLRKAEEEESRKSGLPLHGLEEAQRRILSEASDQTLTADREGKLEEQRGALLVKLEKLRHLQRIYTPAASRCIKLEAEHRDPDAPPIKVEKVKLYLPSELSDDERAYGCQRGMAGMEADMREAQCVAALVVVRSQLHRKRHLIGFRNGQIAGQYDRMRSRTLIGLVSDRADASAEKYRRACMALFALKGAKYMERFKDLTAADLMLDGEGVEESSDKAARKKLAMIRAGKGARQLRHLAGESKKVLSWIWSVQ